MQLQPTITIVVVKCRKFCKLLLLTFQIFISSLLFLCSNSETATNILRNENCPHPGIPENGYAQIDNNSVIYSCIADYRLIGNHTRICDLETLTWNNQIPYCTISQPIRFADAISGSKNYVELNLKTIYINQESQCFDIELQPGDSTYRILIKTGRDHIVMFGITYNIIPIDEAAPKNSTSGTLVVKVQNQNDTVLCGHSNLNYNNEYNEIWCQNAPLQQCSSIELIIMSSSETNEETLQAFKLCNASILTQSTLSSSLVCPNHTDVWANGKCFNWPTTINEQQQQLVVDNFTTAQQFCKEINGELISRENAAEIIEALFHILNDDTDIKNHQRTTFWTNGNHLNNNFNNYTNCAAIRSNSPHQSVLQSCNQTAVVLCEFNATNCGTPHLPEGFISFQPVKSRYNVGDSIILNCSDQRKLEGSAVRICESTGKWSGQNTFCRQKYCKSPSKIAHGKITPSKQHNLYTHGSLVMFQCDPNFIIIGDHSIKCVHGNWNNTPPECQEMQPQKRSSCEEVIIENATVTYTNEEKVAVIECLSNFTLNIPNLLICNNGLWNTSTTPQCNPAMTVINDADKDHNRPNLSSQLDTGIENNTNAPIKDNNWIYLIVGIIAITIVIVLVGFGSALIIAKGRYNFAASFTSRNNINRSTTGNGNTNLPLSLPSPSSMTCNSIICSNASPLFTNRSTGFCGSLPATTTLCIVSHPTLAADWLSFSGKSLKEVIEAKNHMIDINGSMTTIHKNANNIDDITDINEEDTSQKQEGIDTNIQENDEQLKLSQTLLINQNQKKVHKNSNAILQTEELVADEPIVKEECPITSTYDKPCHIEEHYFVADHVTTKTTPDNTNPTTVPQEHPIPNWNGAQRSNSTPSLNQLWQDIVQSPFYKQLQHIDDNNCENYNNRLRSSSPPTTRSVSAIISQFQEQSGITAITQHSKTLTTPTEAKSWQILRSLPTQPPKDCIEVKKNHFHLPQIKSKCLRSENRLRNDKYFPNDSTSLSSLLNLDRPIAPIPRIQLPSKILAKNNNNNYNKSLQNVSRMSQSESNLHTLPPVEKIHDISDHIPINADATIIGRNIHKTKFGGEENDDDYDDEENIYESINERKCRKNIDPMRALYINSDYEALKQIMHSNKKQQSQINNIPLSSKAKSKTTTTTLPFTKIKNNKNIIPKKHKFQHRRSKSFDAGLNLINESKSANKKSNESIKRNIKNKTIKIENSTNVGIVTNVGKPIPTIRSRHMKHLSDRPYDNQSVDDDRNLISEASNVVKRIKNQLINESSSNHDHHSKTNKHQQDNIDTFKNLNRKHKNDNLPWKCNTIPAHRTNPSLATERKVQFSDDVSKPNMQ